MSSEVDVYNHLVNVIHLFNGVFLWEFFTTLDFEWEVFTGRRPWKWSFAVYFVARLLTMGSTILTSIGLNLTTPFNCTVWFRLTLIFAWFSVAVASFLLVLRGAAIWGRNKVVTCITVAVWSANVASSLWSSAQAQAVWSPTAHACVVSGTGIFRWSILVNLIVDLSLLCIMFIGVLHKKNATYLWRMLYFQGISWILIAIATGVPPLVLPYMGLDDAWNLMFQVPHMVLMVIMSTRLYRDLFQYITNDHNPFARRRPNLWPHHQNVQVSVYKTVEVDVDLSHIGAAQPGLRGDYKQAATVRSKAELELITAELQMKKDLQI